MVDNKESFFNRFQSTFGHLFPKIDLTVVSSSDVSQIIVTIYLRYVHIFMKVHLHIQLGKIAEVNIHILVLLSPLKKLYYQYYYACNQMLLVS